MQKAVFGISDLNITQGYYGTYSHMGRFALDIIGKNSNYIELKAPFDGVIKRIYSNDGNVVWLESLEKVQYANGDIDYMTVMTMHDNDVSDLYVGKVIKQGANYYHSGTADNTTGEHIHIETGKGKFTGNGWHKNDYGKWIINNSIKVNDALFLPLNTIIKYDYGYEWIRENDDRKYNEIYNLQNALNNSFKVKLNSGIYDTATRNVIAKNNLKYKSPTIKNDFVKWAQKKLTEIGYDLEVDGSYGKKSTAAVKDFQEKYNLKVDGIIGNGVVTELLKL